MREHAFTRERACALVQHRSRAALWPASGEGLNSLAVACQCTRRRACRDVHARSVLVLVRAQHACACENEGISSERAVPMRVSQRGAHQPHGPSLITDSHGSFRSQAVGYPSRACALALRSRKCWCWCNSGEGQLAPRAHPWVCACVHGERVLMRAQVLEWRGANSCCMGARRCAPACAACVCSCARK